MRHLLIWLALLASTPLAAQQTRTVRPRAGMVITRSVKLAPGTYRLPSRSDSLPVLTIRGDGITVDLRGVTLIGAPSGTDPDQATGLAILIDGGRDITVKGGRVRGYQTGIRAVGTTDLTLLDNNLSDNWRPRLFSGIGHESLVDWLSFHHNENGEWRRFGAGIALEGVHRGTIKGNTVRRGMNGLMLTRSDSIRIEGNDFSFNSGVGIGMYRATDNVVVRNRVDYNVRGFSRYYRRGQDSADLLMFEQSSRNVVAWNSMTHGGDGLFLWAGQSTMDTGEGGSNDNRFLANDFSYAPTNGMEATFSRNEFSANRVRGSDHGLWGGYSFDSFIFNNCFRGNRIGVAIEHGQGNTLRSNQFIENGTGISLWADSIAPSDWGYPRHRDTRSRDWHLVTNRYARSSVALRVRQTTDIVGLESYSEIDTLMAARDTARVDVEWSEDPPRASLAECSRDPTPLNFDNGSVGPADTTAIPSTAASMMDRSAIIVDEWGPYDWSAPRLWPVDSTRDGPTTLQVLGPSGRWRVAGQQGIASLSRKEGDAGDSLIVTPATGHDRDWRLDLSDGRGRPFSFERFDPIPGWHVRYLPWSSITNWGAESLLERYEPRLDLMWYRPAIRELPPENWALEARTEVALPSGVYTLRTISDDAVRVWLDGRLLIDHWDPHESAVDHAPIPPGKHSIRVQYRQVDGWSELRVEIVRGRVTSTGSPGPH